MKYKSNCDIIKGFHRGQIVKHCSNGKVKVYIPEIYREEYLYKPDYLPDAELAIGLGDGGSFSDYSIHYPNIGAIVWVFFANEDQNYPVVFAIIPGGKYSSSNFEKTSEFDIKDDYDNKGLCKYDYKKKHPTSCKSHGNCSNSQTYDGKCSSGVNRHENTKNDSVLKPYSYTMHVYNFFLTTLFAKYPLKESYFVFDSGDYSKPQLFKVYDTKCDENKISTDHIIYNYETKSLSSIFENCFNRSDCLGISCVLKQKVADEEQFKTDMWKFMFCPSARNKNIHKYGEGDGKEIWNNFDYKKILRPNQNGIKSVFMCLDGSSRHPQLEICLSNDASFYVCNGAQYNVIPEYFDRTFQNEKVYYCPKNMLPSIMGPDVTNYNVNLMVIDPQRIGSCITQSKDGTCCSKTKNLYTESTFEETKNGVGSQSKIGKLQRMETPGGYSTIRGNISSYTYYEETLDLSAGGGGCSGSDKLEGAGEKKTIFRYYEAPQKQYVHRISCVTIENMQSGISAYQRDRLNGWKPYPKGHCITDYIGMNDDGLNPCPNTIHHDTIYRNENCISNGLVHEDYLSTYYAWSNSPCKGISSQIWHDVSEPCNPTLHISAAWSDYKSKILKYVQIKLFGKTGYLSVVATDDIDVRAQWYPDIYNKPGWQYETSFSHVHMTKCGDMTIHSTKSLDVEVSPVACPKALTQTHSPKCRINMCNDGNMIIEATNSITMKSPTINLEGQTLNENFSTVATLTTPTNNVNATTNHNGTINVSENVIVDGVVTDSGCTLATHTHSFTDSDGDVGITEIGVG